MSPTDTPPASLKSLVDDSLLKRYAVEKSTPSGWLVLSSHDTMQDAYASRPGTDEPLRIYDQIARREIVSYLFGHVTEVC